MYLLARWNVEREFDSSGCGTGSTQTQSVPLHLISFFHFKNPFIQKEKTSK